MVHHHERTARSDELAVECNCLARKHFVNPAPGILIRGPRFEPTLSKPHVSIEVEVEPKSDRKVVRYRWFIDNRLAAEAKQPRFLWDTEARDQSTISSPSTRLTTLGMVRRPRYPYNSIALLTPRDLMDCGTETKLIYSSISKHDAQFSVSTRLTGDSRYGGGFNYLGKSNLFRQIGEIRISDAQRYGR